MKRLERAFPTAGLLHALRAFRCALAARARSCSTRRRRVVEGRKLELGAGELKLLPAFSPCQWLYRNLRAVELRCKCQKKNVKIKFALLSSLHHHIQVASSCETTDLFECHLRTRHSAFCCLGLLKSFNLGMRVAGV